MKMTKEWDRLSRRLRKRAVFTATLKEEAALKAQRGEAFKAALLALADEWMSNAQSRMRSLERSGPDDADREALESTAIAFARCSMELRELVSGPASSRTPPEPTGRMTPPA